MNWFGTTSCTSDSSSSFRWYNNKIARMLDELLIKLTNGTAIIAAILHEAFLQD